MSGHTGQAAGDGGGTIHAREELARLAAVAVCPDAVPASDWLTEVWGQEPEFGHPGDADAAARALQGHYNRVARALAETPQTYAAVFDMDNDGAGAWWDGWMLGFERGMELEEKSWAPNLRSGATDAAMALRLLNGMCRLVQGEACAGLAEAIEEDVDRLAHNKIRHFVIWMNDWKRQAETGLWALLWAALKGRSCIRSASCINGGPSP